MRVEMDGDTEMWLLVHGKKRLTNMLHGGKKGFQFFAAIWIMPLMEL